MGFTILQVARTHDLASQDKDCPTKKAKETDTTRSIQNSTDHNSIIKTGSVNLNLDSYKHDDKTTVDDVTLNQIASIIRAIGDMIDHAFQREPTYQYAI